MSERTTYLPKKEKMFSQIQELSQKYNYLCISKLEKVRSVQLMMLRKMLKDNAKFMVVKNKIALRALSNTKFGYDLQLEEKLKGQTLLIFTNQNPFKLSLTLSKNKVSLPAKAGDIATDDIIIPAGNTGLQPGPILSEFKEIGVPTKIDSGSIWVAKDTVVAKKGDIISPKLAGLLSKLNIKPIKAGLTVSFAFMDGITIGEQDLMLDLEKIRNDIQSAYLEAKNLAINSNYFTRDTIIELLNKAYQQAWGLSLNVEYITRENVATLLQKYELIGKQIYGKLKEKGYN
ncbi:MAG: 50S ribosomal protein L10 [Nitrososphaeria archaeon]|nr:50S ribosomal protein L10 [Nitrososphaeria archaeon]